MSEITLSRLRIYPIKACAGTDVQYAYIDARGLRYDRRWMLVHEDGSDVHQLDYPQLANIVVALEENALFVQAPGMSPLHIPLQMHTSQPVMVQWYDGTCEALPVSKDVDSWFQDFLHTQCHLVFMPEDARHPVEHGYEIEHELTAFMTFHFHLLSEASLEDLNGRLETPVTIERFRPNLVIAGTSPFAEDSWRVIRMHQQVFYVVKPCARCAITTVDPARGVKTGKEPLRTLARYRTFEKKVLFGQYLLARKTGMLQVGDRVEVLEWQKPLIVS